MVRRPVSNAVNIRFLTGRSIASKAMPDKVPAPLNGLVNLRLATCTNAGKIAAGSLEVRVY
jgi:hypothetical protein